MAPQRRIDVVLDSVKRLLRIGATANLLNLLQKQHPADLAQVFGSLLDTERQAVFSLLVERNGRLAMETVSEMGPEEGAKLLTGRSAEEIAKLLQEIPSDDAAALIDYLPEELSAEVLELMRRRESGQVESLLEYGEQTAGRIMNPQVFALSEDLTVGEAITALQSSRDVEMVFYLYVVDARRHLVGVTSLRRLLLVSPETPLKRIMTPEVTSVRVDTDQEEVARQVASYNLLAVPVVDEENKLVGIVTVDDVIDVIKDEATEDLLRLAGVSGDERIATPAWEAIRKRLPWLGVNLGDRVPRRLGGRAVRGHDSTGHGAGDVHADRRGHGRQRRHADPDRDRARPGARASCRGTAPARRSRRKRSIGLGNGVALGVVAAGIAWATKADPMLGLLLGMAMVVNMFVAATAGTLVPLGLKAMKIDPALASSVFITTFTDVVGFASFLGLATIFLRYLVKVQ